MKKNKKHTLTDAMLAEIAQEAEKQLLDELPEIENTPEHVWTKGWDDIQQRLAKREAEEFSHANPLSKPLLTTTEFD